MANLIETIVGAISPGSVDIVADRIGESPQATHSAVSALVPVILAAMARKIEQGGGAGIINMIKNAVAGGNPLDHPASAIDTLGNERGGSFVPALLGSAASPIAVLLAQRLNLKPSSASALLSAAGALSAGGISRVLGTNATLPALAGLLRSEQGAISAAMPSGVANLMARDDVKAVGSIPRDDRLDASPVAPGPTRWLPWLLLVLGILAAIFALATCRDRASVGPANVDTTAVTAPPPTQAPIPTGAGVVQETRNAQPALIVYFDVGKSDVTKDLSAAVSRVKEYLVAHPGTMLSISGYNDPTGNVAANAELSKRRAQQVAASLVAAGIPSSSFKLDKPAETTGTAPTNAQSRRVEVTVKQ